METVKKEWKKIAATVAAVIVLIISLFVALPVIFPPIQPTGSVTVLFDPISDSYDGMVYSGTGSNYQTLHDAGSGSSVSTSVISFGQDYDVSYEIWRGLLSFNTSSIPDDATVSAAKLCLGHSSDVTDNDFIIHLQNWTDATDGIGTDDYSAFDGVNYDDGLFDTSMWSQTNYNNITISTFTLISLTGNTSICIRSSNDTSSVSPENNMHEYIQAADTGETNPPKLSVTYSLTGPATATFVVYSDSYDGEILGVATGLAESYYYALRDSASGTTTLTSQIYWGQSIGEPYWEIYRGFIRFDTTALDADVTITAAKVCLYGYVEGSDTDFYTRIQKWTDGNDGLGLDDFSAWDNVSYDDGNFYSTAFTVNEYNNITLANFDVIVAGGYTDICIRSSMDIKGQIPADDYEAAADVGQGTEWSLLVITYTSQENAPAYDYVDSQSNIDSVADIGTHSGFTNQKATDLTNDTMIEADYGGSAEDNAENFVDSNTSNIDSQAGYGTSSNFTAQQDANIAFNDTLTEENVGSVSTSMFGRDTYTGSSYRTLGTDDMYGEVFTAPAGATSVYNITFRGRSSSGTRYAKGMLVFANNLTIVPNGVGSIVTLAAVGAWYTSTFSTPPTITASDSYLLAIVSDGVSVRLWQIATTEGNGRVDTTNSYSSPIDPTDASTTTYQISIYCNCSISSSTYKLDYEFSWTTADYDETYEYLCIRTSTFSGTAENLGVDVWDSSWKSISSALTASSWNNISISGNLSSGTIYFRFKGQTEATDPNQNTWIIECNLIHTWSTALNYQLELEEQFTDANFSRTNVELCIFMGPYNTSETISCQYWDGDSWETAIASLTTNAWNNVSIESYSSNPSVTYTIRFKDGTPSSDTARSSWEKDAALIHSWDSGSEPTTLNQGWTNFVVWSADVGHDLGDVSTSLDSETILWTTFVLEMVNGSRYPFINDWTINTAVVISTGDTLYIYCTAADTWSHTY